MEKTNNRTPNPSAGLPTKTSTGKTLREIIHDGHDEVETPVKVSLMALMADDYEMEEEGEFASTCCVCMARKKGAAFIPCGHTFCRLCSRELWVSRGNCPLCKGFVLDILDIFWFLFFWICRGSFWIVVMMMNGEWFQWLLGILCFFFPFFYCFVQSSHFDCHWSVEILW